MMKYNIHFLDGDYEDIQLDWYDSFAMYIKQYDIVVTVVDVTTRKVDFVGVTVTTKLKYKHWVVYDEKIARYTFTPAHYTLGLFLSSTNRVVEFSSPAKEVIFLEKRA